jgi:hypothetical protein
MSTLLICFLVLPCIQSDAAGASDGEAPDRSADDLHRWPAEEDGVGHCPIADSSYFIISPSNTTHGSLTMLNPTDTVNTLLVSVGWKRESVVTIPAHGRHRIDLEQHDPSQTIMVFFNIKDDAGWSVPCTCYFFSEKRTATDPLSYVTPNSLAFPSLVRMTMPTGPGLVFGVIAFVLVLVAIALIGRCADTIISPPASDFSMC